MRDLHDGLLPRRSRVDADDVSGGGIRRVDSRSTGGSTLCCLLTDRRGVRVAPRWTCGSWGRSRFASGTGPSSWAPASSGRCSRCSRWRPGGRCRPTGSRRGCGATSCRRARRRWCSSTSRICGGCSTATALASSPTAAATRSSSRTKISMRCESSACSRSRAPREALALWRGEPLADLADEPFAAAEIRRLEELRLRAAEMAIDADLAAGRHAEVIGELDALVAAHPLRERLHAPADARALPGRAPVGGTRGLPRGARRARGGDRRRAWRRAAAPARAILAHDPALDLPPPAKPSRRPHRAPPPARRSRALLVGAAALCSPASWPSGSSACSSRRARGHRRGLRRPDRSRRRPHHDAVPCRSRPERRNRRRRLGVDRQRGRRHRLAHRPHARRGGARSRWAARPLRSLSAAARYGWPTATAASVAQVDPGANKVVQRNEVGNAPRSLAAAGGRGVGRVGVDGRIRRIDLDRAAGDPPDPGRRESDRDRGRRRRAVGGERGVRAPSRGSTRAAARVVQAIRVGNGPSALAVGEGAVWVVNRHDGTLSRIDPATNSVTWTGAVGSDPTAVAVGEGAVWVAGGEDGTVIRVDPDGPRVVETAEDRQQPSGDRGGGWVGVGGRGAPQSAHRGGTLRVIIPSSPKPSLLLDWLDPRATRTGRRPARLARL